MSIWTIHRSIYMLNIHCYFRWIALQAKHCSTLDIRLVRFSFHYKRWTNTLLWVHNKNLYIFINILCKSQISNRNMCHFCNHNQTLLRCIRKKYFEFFSFSISICIYVQAPKSCVCITFSEYEIEWMCCYILALLFFDVVFFFTPTSEFEYSSIRLNAQHFSPLLIHLSRCNFSCVFLWCFFFQRIHNTNSH